MHEEQPSSISQHPKELPDTRATGQTQPGGEAMQRGNQEHVTPPAAETIVVTNSPSPARPAPPTLHFPTPGAPAEAASSSESQWPPQALTRSHLNSPQVQPGHVHPAQYQTPSYGKGPLPLARAAPYASPTDKVQNANASYQSVADSTPTDATQTASSTDCRGS